MNGDDEYQQGAIEAFATEHDLVKVSETLYRFKSGVTALTFIHLTDDIYRLDTVAEELEEEWFTWI